MFIMSPYVFALYYFCNLSDMETHSFCAFLWKIRLLKPVNSWIMQSVRLLVWLPLWTQNICPLWAGKFRESATRRTLGAIFISEWTTLFKSMWPRTMKMRRFVIIGLCKALSNRSSSTYRTWILLKVIQLKLTTLTAIYSLMLALLDKEESMHIFSCFSPKIFCF